MNVMAEYDEKDNDRASWCVSSLWEPEQRDYCKETLMSLPESLVREWFKIYDLVPPRWLEIHWVAPKIAEQLIRGHQVTVFTPTEISPLRWSVRGKKNHV